MHETTLQALQCEETWETVTVNKEKLHARVGFHQEILTLKATTRGPKCHTINYCLIFAGTHYGCDMG